MVSALPGQAPSLPDRAPSGAPPVARRGQRASPIARPGTSGSELRVARPRKRSAAAASSY